MSNELPKSAVIRRTLPLILPAICLGVLCSLILLAVSFAAGQLEHFWWSWLPAQLGVAGHGPVWIFGVLATTGALVALVVWRIPGHAGPDPAATSLIDAPLAPGVVPGLLIAVMLMLAGGVSLGPENPIMAANIAVMVFLGTKLMPAKQRGVWVSLAIAGTIGALFGTPLAVALLLSEISDGGDSREPLWDRLVLPLTAAGAGALTTQTFVGDAILSVNVPDYPGFRPFDLLSGSIIAALSAAVGLVAIYAYPLSHRLFARLKYQPLMIVCGGVLLGLLGVIGGEITLSKGLDQMKELVGHTTDFTFCQLAAIIGVKLAAIVIAATSGFRGGRIFPSLFVGVAVGVAAQTLFPSIPLSLAVTAGAIGILLAVTRQGWLAFFTAAIVVPQISLIPVLCLIMLPAWLIVSGRPEMVIPKKDAVGS